MREAAKRVRVRRAGRCLPDREDAHDGVELVRGRDEHARERCGQRVAGEPRPVVVEDRLGHALRLARGKRVVAAHDALERRELDDRVRDEVGLGQVRGAGGIRLVVGAARRPAPQARA